MKVISITLDTHKLTLKQANVKARANDALDKSATAIVAAATQNTRRVDTGAMKNGWRWEESEPLQRIIWNRQEYAIFHELGTVHLSASPMLVPAVEGERANLEKRFKDIV